MSDTIRGGTSMYCKLLTLTPERAVIRDSLRERHTFELDITADIYEALRERVGTEIGLLGIATWRISDLAIMEFEVTEVLPYRKVPLSEALQSLRDVVGDAYDKIEDVDAYIRWVRGKDDDTDDDEGFDSPFDDDTDASE